MQTFFVSLSPVLTVYFYSGELGSDRNASWLQYVICPPTQWAL